MDLSPSLFAKQFFRFTGPPEHWLTAIKFMTWGLEEKHRNKWERIQPGDVFFIHSTAAQSSAFPNAKSGIIGIGVVGSNFSVKENFLWFKELEDHQNYWPLLVPLSEIYLFSALPPSSQWESPQLSLYEQTRKLIDQLLRNSIPLSQIKGFPQMGSFSAVSKEVAQQILNDHRPLYFVSGQQIAPPSMERRTKLEKVSSAAEALRFADTLKVFDSVKQRIVNKGDISMVKDNELLAKAEEVHTTILQQLIDLYRSHGYETRFNKHVDLFAHNEDRAFLIEVKSIENKNFRSQARKGIVQLLECDYFDIRAFIAKEGLSFKEKSKLLVPSSIPKDENYIKFMNFLKIGVALVQGTKLQPVGADWGFTRL